MICWLCLLLAVIAVKITMIIMYHELQDVDPESATEHDRRMYIAFLAPYYLIGVINMASVATILYMFLKHSNANLSSAKRT